MYVRRKVFSLLEDVDGEVRYFSTTDFELTDGSEERYYSDDEKKGMSKAAKVALGTGAGLAAVAGGIYGAKKGGAAIRRGAAEARRHIANAAHKGQLSDDNIKALMKNVEKKEGVAKVLEAPGDYVVRVGKAGKAKVVGEIDALKNKVKKDGKKAAKDAAKK